jgi:hypothetical protein
LTAIDHLLEDAEQLMAIPKGEFKGRIPKLWDGKTSERIIDKFLSML